MGSPLDILKTLMDNSDQQQTMNLNQQDQTQQTRNAYQKGVDSALKKLGEAHATEAVQQGISPEDIANHPLISPSQSSAGNNQQINPAQLLSGLVAAHIASQPQLQNQSPENITPLQKQALDIVAQPKGFGQAFFQALNNATGANQSQLKNIASAQSIAGQEPIQPAQKPVLDLYTTQTAELNQKIQGAEPIQPKDIADLNRQTYSATIQAANDAWQRNNDEIGKMQDQFKILQEGRGGFAKAVGGQTSQMKKLQDVIVAKMQQNQQHLANLQTIIKNPPSAASTQQQSSPFQVGQQYNGETIKNVRRIK